MTPRFRPGEPALFRFVWPWKVFSAKPTTVVEHSPERTALWLAPNTLTLAPPGFHVAVPQIRAGDWTHEDWRWYGGRLMIWEAGSSHSIYVTWSDDGEFLGWYANLEDPWRDSRPGFDATDHLLDVVIRPDRTWSWKDADHVDEAIEVGLFTPERAQAFREEGERVIERVEAWTAPFDEGWESWTPDPEWPLPTVPAGWDQL
jgi:Protein of unknown function (DUF402)